MAQEPTKTELWPADNPAVTGHITVLQNIITRLANNSASCKTWCLTLIAALLSVAGAAKSPQVAMATIVPLVVFGYLDVMYLATEKGFRDHYNRLVDKIVSEKAGEKYTRRDLFNAKASWDTGTLIWALASWSVYPYYALVACYAAACLRGWFALLGP